MKVTTISASVRHSRPLDDGSQKMVELSAETTVAAEEKWQQAQAALYTESSRRLKAL